jgi:GNAT superfamily N-acetyltransferase
MAMELSERPESAGQPGEPVIGLYDGYRPGVLGRIADLHGAYYHPNWGLDHTFETDVATELAEFLANFESGRDGLWLATVNGVVEGSIALDGRGADSDAGARLRWFLLSDVLRGRGVGRQLVERCIQFCHDCGYSRVELFTFEGLHQARRLYEAFGFELVKEWPEEIWGTTIQEQRFVYDRT